MRSKATGLEDTWVVRITTNRVHAQIELGEFAAASRELEAHVSRLRALPHLRAELVDALEHWGSALQARGSNAEAEARYREGLGALAAESSGPSRTDGVAWMTCGLAETLRARALPGSRPLFEESLRLGRQRLAEERRRRGQNWLDLQTREYLLGRSLVGLGRVAEAEPLLRRGFIARQRWYGERSYRTRVAAALLADVYLALGRSEDAATYRAMAVAEKPATSR